MTVLTNTTTTDDIEYALDVEMITNFNQDVDKLAELLGIVSPEVLHAGTALYQYTVSGSLDTTERAEGDEVALSLSRMHAKRNRVCQGDVGGGLMYDAGRFQVAA